MSSYSETYILSAAGPDTSAVEADLSERLGQLSIFTAVVGLLAASIKTCNDLLHCSTTSSLPNSHYMEIKTVVQAFKHTTLLIYKLLGRAENDTFEHKHRLAMVKVDFLVISLSEASLALSELGNYLASVSRYTRGQRNSHCLELLPWRYALRDRARRIKRADSMLGNVLSIFQTYATRPSWQLFCVRF